MTRRLGREDSATRTLLLDAAEQIMIEQGFGAVTSRRLAERVGLTHQSVFYYFGTVDDLFIAMIQRNGESFRDRLNNALATGTPLTALWNLACHRQSAVIELELKAMAVHNERVRQALTDTLEAYRVAAVEHLARILGERSSAQAQMSWALATLIEGVGRHLVMDESLGMTKGHSQTIAFIEQAIAWAECTPPAATS